MYTIEKVTNLEKSLQKFPDSYFDIVIANPLPKTEKWSIYPSKDVTRELFRLAEKVAYIDEHNGAIYIYTRAGYLEDQPLVSYEDAILSLCASGDLVLDFTCGTSHVAEACAKLGQDFVGLETDLHLYKRKIQSVKEGFGYAIV